MPMFLSRVIEKVLLTFSLLACITTLLPMALLGGAFSVLCLARFIYGMFQVILITYIMVWVETVYS